MALVSCRPSRSVLLSLPASLVLAGLFFLPWLEVTCAASGYHPAEKLGTASGWQLARGQISTCRPFSADVRVFARQHGVPRKRPWLFACLVLPGVALVAAGLCLAGTISPGGARITLLLCGLGALAAALAACCMNYPVNDVFRELERNSSARVPDMNGLRSVERLQAMRDRAASRQAEARFRQNLRKLTTVRPTRYLWAVVGLSGLLAACGVLTRSVPVVRRRERPPEIPDYVPATCLPPPSACATAPEPQQYPVYQPHRQPRAPGDLAADDPQVLSPLQRRGPRSGGG